MAQALPVLTAAIIVGPGAELEKHLAIKANYEPQLQALIYCDYSCVALDTANHLF